MRIGIPLFETRVSPRFDFAPCVQIVAATNHGIGSREVLNTDGWSSRARVDALCRAGVDIVVCGGIDGFSQRQLERHGVRVVSWVTGEAEDALQALVAGRLEPGSMTGWGGVCCGRWRFRRRRGCPRWPQEPDR